MDYVIRVCDVVKAYQAGNQVVRALDGINLEVRPAEMISITGSSGSGKSTLMNIIGCLDVPTSGFVEIDGVSTSGMDEKTLSVVRGKKIGFVFQQYNLLGYLSVLENVELPLIYQGVAQKERRERAVSVLERVGLANRMSHLPGELSGGQKQRTAIARSIIANPSVILADEPTGALDSKTGMQIMSLFKELNSNGSSVIIVTHDERVAQMAGRIIRLMDGRIMS